ncbi:MAG: HAD hydrolase family protein [Nitrososphaeraceae archaeon]
MERRQIDVFLSDYDGTLCPTTSVRGDSGQSKISNELKELLFCISRLIPLCIISSKEFAFLHKRTRFAKILSCVLGIETVFHRSHDDDNKISNFNCIDVQHLIVNRQTLYDNSKVLYNLTKILQSYKDVMIEEKYTSDKEILIGLTIDYRHLDNWQLFKKNKEPSIREMIQRSINANLATNSPSKYRPFIQTYSSHPFLDIYGVECNKGLAFDNVLSQLKQEKRGGNVMYLGDSENDNPAFRKSDIPIGIRSDARLNPILDCKYMLDFNRLPIFLRGLIDNHLMFSDELITIK